MLNSSTISNCFMDEVGKDAAAAFQRLGYPHKKLEDWRFTDTSLLKETDFSKSRIGEETYPIYGHRFENMFRIVLANGIFDSGQSDVVDGVEATSLYKVVSETPKILKPYLGKVADFNSHSFLAQNTAEFVDGVYLRIPKNMVVGSPIHILHYTQAETQPHAVYPRIFIHAEAGSEFSIIEQFITEGNLLNHTNSATEIIAEKGSRINHIRIQDEGDQSLHTSYTGIRQTQDSMVKSQTFTLSGKFVRNDVNVDLDEQSAESQLNGLFLAKGKDFVDNHTVINHKSHDTISRETYKGILKNSAHGVFNGLVNVHQPAVNTDSAMENRNLLLSETALVNSNPQLEIYCDEVSCSHGSTTGQIDEDALFYFRSRGIPKVDALQLLVSGFANEVLDVVNVEEIQVYLKNRLKAWIS